MSTLHCPTCGPDVLSENFQGRGDVVCTGCGRVLEESSIVPEVSFADGNGGTSALVGQFVSNTGPKPYSSARGGPQVLQTKESREQTIRNGRDIIEQISSQLHMKKHHRMAALRYFTLALQKNFVQGRKTRNVVAACLYIVCRRERMPHMLMDFSEVLGTDVYALGHTFLRFCRVAKITLPIIDPSLFIHRFAAKMDFGSKTQQVANTALRLVKRMRRDWIQTGRRPSGICGAALMIAAKMHGFHRTQREVVDVVKICDVTLRNRLNEFQDTPTGDMTCEEFLAGDGLDDAMDAVHSRPPAFKNKEEEEEEIETHLRRSRRISTHASHDHVQDIERQFASTLDEAKVLAKFDSNEQRAVLRKRKRSDATAALSHLKTSVHGQPRKTQFDQHGRRVLTVIRRIEEDESYDRRWKAKAAQEDLSSASEGEDAYDGYLLTRKEKKAKEKVWLNVHDDYLKEQAQKKKLQQEKEEMVAKRTR